MIISNFLLTNASYGVLPNIYFIFGSTFGHNIYNNNFLNIIFRLYKILRNI